MNIRQNMIIGFFVLIIIATSYILIMKMTPFGLATTLDSVNYLESARNIRAGKGIVLNNYNISAKSNYIPFTTWPPLYPLILSLFISPDTSDMFATSRFSVIALAASGLMMFFLLRSVVGYYVSLVATLVYFVSTPTLTVYSYVWSETSFIPLILFSCWCFLRCTEIGSEVGSRRLFIYLFLFVTSLASLFYCRYIGIVFVLLIPLAWGLSKERLNHIFHYSIAVIWYLILTVGLIIRNYFLTGFLSGDIRPDSGLSLQENIVDLFKTLAVLFPQKPEFLVLGVLTAFAIVLFKSRLHRQDKPNNRSPYLISSSSTHLMVFSAVSSITYLGSLIFLRTMKHFDPITIRYLSLFFPFLVILVFQTAHKAWHARDRIRLHTLLFMLSMTLIITLTIQGVITYHRMSVSWQENGSPNLLCKSGYIFRNFTFPPKKNDIKTIISELQYNHYQVFITEQPRILNFCTGAEVKKYPSGSFNPEKIELLNAVKNGVIILYDRSSFNELTAYYGKRMSNLKILTKYLKHNLLVLPLPLPLIGATHPS